MAKVLVSVRVYPEGLDVDLRRLRERIEALMPKGITIYRYGEEPIAFGIRALVLHILLPEDRGGEMDRVEDIIHGVRGVSEIETLTVRRV